MSLPVPPPPKGTGRTGGIGTFQAPAMEMDEGSMRLVKIRVKDYPNIRFSKDDVERFFARLEMAADMEGAGPMDIVRQVGNFIGDERDLRDVEEMEGYKGRDWERLKEEMLQRWGIKPLRYQEGDLEAFVLKLAQTGGVKTMEGFRKYKASFERISTELAKLDALPGGGPLKRLYLKGLSTDVADCVKRRLFMENKIIRSHGSLVFPSVDILKKATEEELDFRRLNSAGEVEMTGRIAEEMAEVYGEAVPMEDVCYEHPRGGVREENQGGVDDLVRQIANLKAEVSTLKEARRIMPSRGATPGGGAMGSSRFSCWYCGAEGHTKPRCTLLTRDLDSKKVQISGQDYYLPDGRLVVVGPGQTAAQVVEQQSKSAPPPPSTNLKSAGGSLGAWKPPVVNAGFRPTELRQTRPEVLGKSSGNKVPFSRRIASWVLSAGINAPISKTIKELSEIAPEVARDMVRMLEDQVGVKGEAKTYANQAELVEELEKEEKTELRSCGTTQSTGKLSCPLGYVPVSIKGLEVMAMVDSGSMVNIIPARDAQRGQIAWVERGVAPITGIGGHETLVHGVCTSTPVEVAGVQKKLHFLVSEVPQPILGRPFLYEFGASLEYGGEGQETLRLTDGEGRGVVVAICSKESGDWPDSPDDMERMVGRQMAGGKGLGSAPVHFQG